MLPLTARCTLNLFRSPIARTQWHQTLRRLYSVEPNSIPKAPVSPSGDPEWFQKLREQMLNRELPPLLDRPSKTQEDALANTLSAFLPAGFETSFRTIPYGYGESQPHTLGNHLVFFNPTVPTSELLPDGTDSLQSPGDPFVRRMWAGGSVRVNPEAYFQPPIYNGWALDQVQMCTERIKEVALRGTDDLAKIFVTIERRIAMVKALKISMATSEPKGQRDVARFFQQQARKEDSWGDAYLIEERNLVFMRKRSKAELEAVKAGAVAPVKYLKAPEQPDFFHTLTPTRSLLFRFSALTFNAHAIHLDQGYCREVEGQHNLLVHGPLTLMLMLKFISSHLRTLDGPQRFIESIAYRNLAPLYCDEALRLCARAREGSNTSSDNITFDIWIEGPTGGTAVTGAVVSGIRRDDRIRWVKTHSTRALPEFEPFSEPILPIVPDISVVRGYWTTSNHLKRSNTKRARFPEQGVRLITPNKLVPRLVQITKKRAQTRRKKRYM